MLILSACGTQASTIQADSPGPADGLQPTFTATPQSTSTPFQPVAPTVTQTGTATPIPTATSLPTATNLPTDTPEPLPVEEEAAASSIPDEYFISGIYGHAQSFSISCEASAAADWAVFFGKEAYEATIQFSIPLSDNPDKGFVGNVHDPWGQVPPYSYGVHAEPIATVLRDIYDLPAQAEKGFTLEEVKQEIADNQPVLAWVIGNMVIGYPSTYTDKNGESSVVAAYEHSVILTGYSQGRIRYLNNGRFFEVPTDVFLRSWEVLGNMVVFYN